jgi:hypothetical protein
VSEAAELAAEQAAAQKAAEQAEAELKKQPRMDRAGQWWHRGLRIKSDTDPKPLAEV